MSRNVSNAVTTVATVSCYAAWFMMKLMSAGVRTRKVSGRKF